jgi:hypothetical protein
MTPVAQGPVYFKAMRGCLSVGRRLFDAFGLNEWWAGEDNFEGVIRDKLRQMGVPDQPIPLSGQGSMTPRQMAESSGFLKKARPHRRLKAK